jgi:DNA polymerase III sliding clamp (beta) subunit (PCNA family)
VEASGFEPESEKVALVTQGQPPTLKSGKSRENIKVGVDLLVKPCRPHATLIVTHKNGGEVEMLIKVEPRALLDALKRVAPFTATRYVMPILQAVKITANDGNLTVSATDTDSGISYKVTNAEVLKDGVAVIPAKPLIHLLQNLNPYCEVELEAPEEWGLLGKATLKFPEGVYRLHIFDPQDYPSALFEIEGKGAVVSVIGSDLAQALKFASNFAGSHTYWQANDVVWVTPKDEELWVAGTDTHKLGLARVPAFQLETHNGKVELYLPVSRATAIATACENEPSVTLRLSERGVIVEGGKWQVWAFGREVSHLNIEHVLRRPMERATTIELASTQPILNFLQRVKSFDHQSARRHSTPAAGMHIKVTATEAGLELEAHARENWGEERQLVGRTQIGVDDFKGVPTTVWVSRRLLTETLQAFKGYKVKIDLEAPTKDNLKPLVVTALDAEPFKLMALLMPLIMPSDATDADEATDEDEVDN